MAGGGVKPGFTYGATGEFGYYAVEDRMHVHDLHARRSSTCRASTTGNSLTSTVAGMTGSPEVHGHVAQKIIG